MKRTTFWKTLKKKIVYSTPWLTVKEETVKLPNGEIVDDYSTVELRDVAMIFPLTEDNHVIMVKQYRHGVKQVLLELPAGTYKKGEEDAEEAAKRELQEETGYLADELNSLGELYDYPTKDTHSIKVFIATNIIYNPIAHREKTELVDCIKIPFEDLNQYIFDGKIKVAGTIASIHLAQLYKASHG